MGFEIKDLLRTPTGAMYVSPARICVTADGRVTDESDPEAVRLLVAKGGEIPATEAAQYGLIAESNSPSKAEAEPTSPPPETEEPKEKPKRK